MEKCICGREFETKAQLRGHQSHCREHLGEEKYQERCELQKKASKAASKSRVEVAEEKYQKEIEEWYSQPRYCAYCGKLLTEKYASGRFCNHSCASGWVGLNQSEEAKAIKIEKGKKNLRPNPHTLINLVHGSWTEEQSRNIQRL